MVSLPFTFEPAAVPLVVLADLPPFPAIEELKARRQWVGWKYEDRGGEKPTKPPVSPLTGFGASHSKPTTWGSYGQAMALAERRKLPGVGYVLSEDDDLTGADLDRVRDPDTEELEAWAQAIVDLAETYVEVSPSGTGLRLIWRGKVERTLKSDPCSVEVYRSQRYLTITGRHLDGTPEEIRPAPRTWAALQARVEAWRAEHEGTKAALGIPITEQAQPLAPADPSGSPFFRNVNTAALASLHAWVPGLFGAAARFQPGTGAFRVSSKALGRNLEEDLSIAPTGIRDWGVGDMGDARLGARTPIDLVIQFGAEREPMTAALALCRQMGREPGGLGYEDRDAAGAALAAGLLARAVVEAADGTLADAETGEVIEPTRADDELPAHLADPPGLVGALADWICNTSRRPQRGLAIGAGLVTVGTAAGRHIMGPTRSGTHLYVIGLAPTGAGKDHPMQAVMTALASVEATHLIGPSQFISMPAVINFLMRKPLSVCAMDEFGAFMKRIQSRKASGFESAISGMLRTAWSSSFKAMPTPEWAGRQSETILAPAMSIFGVSTAEEFYGALGGGDMSNGLLNRMLVVETRERPRDRAPKVREHGLPEELADGLRGILQSKGEVAFGQLQRHDVVPVVTEAEWGEGAEADYAALVEEVHRICDGAVLAEAFYARVAETSVRLATILAVGIDPVRPIVTRPLFAWGREFALWCARSLERGGIEHIADSENQSVANAVRRAIREVGGRIRHRDLLRRLNHRIKNRDLIDVVKALAEAEHITIEKVVPAGGGTPSVWYGLAGESR